MTVGTDHHLVAGDAGNDETAGLFETADHGSRIG